MLPVLMSLALSVLQPPVAPVDLSDWTPRPATGKAEPWEKMIDPQWDDKRFQSTNTGPMFGCTFRVPLAQPAMAYKAMAIKLGDNAGVAFDRNTMNLLAGWTGGYINISAKRFGLLNTPTPHGPLAFTVTPGFGWTDDREGWAAIAAGRHTAPPAREWLQYRGLSLHRDRVVLRYRVGGTEIAETSRGESFDGKTTIIRTIRVGATKRALTLRTAAKPVLIPASETATVLTLVNNVPGSTAKPDDIEALSKPGPVRWGKPLVTKLVRGDARGPFAIDTLTIPQDNPFQALFFCTAVDFLPDGRVVVCTAHGDVWLVRMDEANNECHWQRFATGLYQPLGLKVVEGNIIVLERGQLTRLRDTNHDGEADDYECINNDWHCSGGEHSYDTSLETDPAGNFFFHKTGDTDTPTGGCLLKVSKDGSKAEVYSTGFRHPIGLGMSPTGIVTGADQEGNWMPATRIDEYKPGGFYGDMRAHHRTIAPTISDPPLCWLPREVDNSAGGQVWLPNDPRWGPLAGLPLHLSYGRCKAFVLLRQQTAHGVQGGVADTGLRFLSGARAGRVHPIDGQLYVVGLNGWQTAAQADGSLQRVRKTEQPLDLPVKLNVVKEGVTLTFSRPLDAKTATDLANFKAAMWNYRWRAEYGSKRWKVSNPNVEGQDDVQIEAVALSEDRKTITLRFRGGAVPVMQLQIGYNVTAADDRKAITGSVFLTVHETSGK